jgi:uncharacterized protein
MIEPLSPPATCRACGALINEPWPASGGLCSRCATLPQGEVPPANTPQGYPPAPVNTPQIYPPPANAQQVYPPPASAQSVYPPPANGQPIYPPQTANAQPGYPTPPVDAQQAYPPSAYPNPGYPGYPGYRGYPSYQAAPGPQVIDPDRPRWGIWSGVGAWSFSVAALFVAQIAVIFLLYFWDQYRGASLPSFADKEALQAWLLSPRVIAWSVYSTLFAHLMTVLFCWAIVTRLGKQPFFESLGWNWTARSVVFWLVIGVAIFIGINVANAGFSKILPQKETDFDVMLKAGPQVRIAVAILASFSAPLVEEFVYRGVIFGGLRKYLNAGWTIAIVSILFLSVHILQYSGAWASLAGLGLLSLVLTTVRAKTKSLLPCVVIHFVNNAVVSLAVLLNKGN